MASEGFDPLNPRRWNGTPEPGSTSKHRPGSISAFMQMRPSSLPEHPLNQPDSLEAAGLLQAAEGWLCPFSPRLCLIRRKRGRLGVAAGQAGVEESRPRLLGCPWPGTMEGGCLKRSVVVP